MPLTVNWDARARRFTLRVDPRTGGARLTVPRGADLDDATAFLRRHERWLMDQRRNAAGPVPFVAGATVPLRGVDHEIRLTGSPGRRVWIDAAADEVRHPVIQVAGATDMVAIRVARFLKSEARADLEQRASAHARSLGLGFERIAIRDQRTRWGSCSSSGTLSFSWRLVMAPPFVLDYVAAHEVAHLREMNHGPRFWRLVGQMAPDMDHARSWLTRHGPALHAYGAPS